jgi:hypothetical protein
LITALRLAREVDDAHESTRPRAAEDLRLARELDEAREATPSRAANDRRLAREVDDAHVSTLPRAAELPDMPGKQPSVPPKELDPTLRAELGRVLALRLKDRSPSLIPENDLPSKTMRDMNGTARSPLRVSRPD